MTTIETPFKRHDLIDSAVNTKLIFDVDCVIGLRQFERTIYNHNGKGMVPLNYQKTKLKLERKENYASVPGFILRDINKYLATASITGNRIGHVMFDQEASFYLSSELDLVLAEAIIKYQKEK